MKISRIETIWFDEQPNTLWVQIHTDDGLIGLGETYYVPRAVSAMIHDVFGTLLLAWCAMHGEEHRLDAARVSFVLPSFFLAWHLGSSAKV